MLEIGIIKHGYLHKNILMHLTASTQNNHFNDINWYLIILMEISKIFKFVKQRYALMRFCYPSTLCFNTCLRIISSNLVKFVFCSTKSTVFR